MALVMASIGIVPGLSTLAGMDGWQSLFDDPTFQPALGTAVSVGLRATALSVLLAGCILSAVALSPLRRRLETLMSPVLAVPHAALAIALAFLLSPSGWLVRLFSPGVTGFQRPPDWLIIGDPGGWTLTVALVVKETPFLLLTAIAVAGQLQLDRQIRAAMALGHPRGRAWLLVAAPQLLRRMRLPIFAALSYAMTTVDMAMILGPTRPPTLAVLIVEWAGDNRLTGLPKAAAAALVLTLVVIAAAAAWMAAECALRRLITRSAGRGGRLLPTFAGRLVLPAVAGGLILTLVLPMIATVGLVIWSLARSWRFPDALPAGWTVDHWATALERLQEPTGTTALLAIGVAAVAVALVVLCLENEVDRMRPAGAASQLLIHAPLVLPQVGFLLGFQVVMVWLDVDGTACGLAWSHMIFAVPYAFIVLRGPWQRRDRRHDAVAASLGQRPARRFFRVILPMALRPVALALAVCAAVSVSLYLPTLFAGAGRYATVTTEAVARASGADRRIAAVYALVQMLLPLLLFWAATGYANWRAMRRRGLEM